MVLTRCPVITRTDILDDEYEDYIPGETKRLVLVCSSWWECRARRKRLERGGLIVLAFDGFEQMRSAMEQNPLEIWAVMTDLHLKREVVEGIKVINYLLETNETVQRYVLVTNLTQLPPLVVETQRKVKRLYPVRTPIDYSRLGEYLSPYFKGG